MGFKTAVTLQDGTAESVICWDSGGASFQITSCTDGGLRSYLGALGAGVTTSILVETTQGRALADSPSTNPVTMQQAVALTEELKKKVPEAAEWLKAIGGPNSMFCVASEALGVLKYGTADVRRVLEGPVGLSDSELASKVFCEGELREPPAYIVPKLCLLLAVLEHCGIAEVKYCHAIGSCPGMLISDDMFAAI